METWEVWVATDKGWFCVGSELTHEEAIAEAADFSFVNATVRVIRRTPKNGLKPGEPD